MNGRIRFDPEEYAFSRGPAPPAESTTDFEDFASSRSSVPPAALLTFQLKLSIWFLTMGPVAAAAEPIVATAWLFLVERARKVRRSLTRT